MTAGNSDHPHPSALRASSLSRREKEGAAQPRKGEGDHVRDALAAAAARFGFSATPRLDAELLMAHVLDVSREMLLLGHLDDPVPDAFADLADRRAAHEPVAYLTGTRAFWTIDVAVGPGALVPRADSETLIEAAVAHFGDRAPRRILDLGTGPGTLLLAALDQWPDATGIGIDASADAAHWFATNAERLGMADRAVFRTGNWAAGIDERFDLILANPPYIATDEPLPPEVSAYEPAAALYGRAEGLDAYLAIAPAVPHLIAPGGMAAIEIGWTQAAAVSALVAAAGLRPRVIQDLGGRDRCIVATA